jgi:hypothetical protein
VDIGQRRDPTAIAVTERRGDGYTVRHVERLPLGTRYPAVVERIVGIIEQLYSLDPRLLLDATGVGMPVVDMVRAALDARDIDIRVKACFFTHGDRLIQEAKEWRVGKAFLVSTLQALLQSRRLTWPRTSETEYLANELLDYEIHVDVNANDKYGAFKVGTHDDVVTAVGLSVIDDSYDRGVPTVSVGDLSPRTPAEELTWRAGQLRAAILGGEAATATNTTPRAADTFDDDEWADAEREAAALDHQARLAHILHGLGDIRLR